VTRADTIHSHTGTDHERISVNTSAAQSRLDGWLEALERLRSVPGSHRDARVLREQALLMLRCGEHVLDELCDRGLPHCGTPPHERYDSSDLVNLALRCGSRRSLPELGVSFVSRTARATPLDWVSEHRWRLGTRAFAEHGPQCGESPSWSFRRPVPEAFGGSCLEWVEGGTVRMMQVNAFPREHASATLDLTGRVVTRGEVRVVRSSVLRELYREVLETMEFFVLPASVETDVDSIVRAKGADCVGIATLLEHECRRAGYRALARRGYLLGILGMGEHCWLEVVDDDDRTKVLDPTLPMVARASAQPTPAFTAFCLGSISNRLLPFDCPVRASIVEHRCGGSVMPSHAITVVEPDDGDRA